MQKTDTVFVAWGGNIELATATVDALTRLGYNGILGGDENAPASSSHLGEKVRKQINSSSAAVILIEDFDKVKQPAGGSFRPNLMFEWGLTLGVVPKNLIFPALIGLKRDRLPSDMQGIWAPEFPQYRTRTGKIKNASTLKTLAENIAKNCDASIKTARSDFSTNPFDVICDWDEITTLIRSNVAAERTFLSSHLRSLLPNIAIPAVYDSRGPEFIELISRLSKTHGSCVPEINLVTTIIEYYIDCQNAVLTETQLQQYNTKFFSYRKYEFSDPISGVIAENFSGLIQRKIGINKSGREAAVHFQRSFKRYQDALAELTKLEDKKRINIQSSNMWKGFIHWNSVRTLSHMKPSKRIDEHFYLARKARAETLINIPDTVSPRIKLEFFFERMVTEIEAAQRKLDDDAITSPEILAHIKHALKHNSRAIGRAVGKAMEFALATKNEKLRKALDEVHRTINS